jgi:hypothetical protein
LTEIESLFPNPEDKLLILDSDGRDRALQALGLLQERGYFNIVAVRGGFNAWNTAFDPELNRRFPDADVGDVERMATVDSVAWLDWAVAMDPCPLKVHGA